MMLKYFTIFVNMHLCQGLELQTDDFNPIVTLEIVKLKENGIKVTTHIIIALLEVPTDQVEVVFSFTLFELTGGQGYYNLSSPLLPTENACVYYAQANYSIQLNGGRLDIAVIVTAAGKTWQKVTSYSAGPSAPTDLSITAGSKGIAFTWKFSGEKSPNYFLLTMCETRGTSNPSEEICLNYTTIATIFTLEQELDTNMSYVAWVQAVLSNVTSRQSNKVNITSELLTNGSPSTTPMEKAKLPYGLPTGFIVAAGTLFLVIVVSIICCTRIQLDSELIIKRTAKANKATLSNEEELSAQVTEPLPVTKPIVGKICPNEISYIATPNLETIVETDPAYYEVWENQIVPSSSEGK